MQVCLLCLLHLILFWCKIQYVSFLPAGLNILVSDKTRTKQSGTRISISMKVLLLLEAYKRKFIVSLPHQSILTVNEHHLPLFM